MTKTSRLVIKIQGLLFHASGIGPVRLFCETRSDRTEKSLSQSDKAPGITALINKSFRLHFQDMLDYFAYKLRLTRI